MPRAYELHLVSTPLQEGQTKIAVPNALQFLGSSGAAWCRRKRGILGPACRPVLAAGIRWRGLRACNTAWRNSTETGGSAIELSATDAWQGADVGDEAYVRLIRKVCEVKF
jgi:hypothetical protein